MQVQGIFIKQVCPTISVNRFLKHLLFIIPAQLYANSGKYVNTGKQHSTKTTKIRQTKTAKLQLRMFLLLYIHAPCRE